MRGKLINPFVAELAQLDTVATAADPDGSSSLASGYDADFREPVIVSDGTTEGVDARQEKNHIYVPCQVEDKTFELMRMYAAGDIPNGMVLLVFHFADLESMGLVDATTGEALIRKNDRLVAIRKCSSLAIVQSVRTPPGLYATETKAVSFGLSGGERNLLVVAFEDREQGVPRAV